MVRIHNLPRALAMVLMLICVPLIREARAQSADALNVDEAFICRQVIARKPVDPGTNFPSSIGKLYCFTRILGANTPTFITHVWYYGNAEQARIDLPVKASHWRTFSKITIRPRDSGVWHVDVLDSSGNRLEVLNFHIDA